MQLVFVGLILMLVAAAFAASVGFELKFGPLNFDLKGRPRLVAGTWLVIAAVLIAGLGLLTAGGVIEYAESETNREIARKTALAALDGSRSTIQMIVAEQTPAGSPTPGPEPSPDELFAQAFSADAEGRNDEAIALYEEAIAAGLRGSKLELAHLEIGLLDVLEIAELDPASDQAQIAARCARARVHYGAATAISPSPTADELRTAIQEACS